MFITDDLKFLPWTISEFWWVKQSSKLGSIILFCPEKIYLYIYTGIAEFKCTYFSFQIKNNCFITGPFTAFIPTDAAFQKIPAPILQKLLNDPVALRSLLLAHVTNGALISPFIKSQDNEVSLAKTNLTLTKDSAGVSLYQLNIIIYPRIRRDNSLVVS